MRGGKAQVHWRQARVQEMVNNLREVALGLELGAAKETDGEQFSDLEWEMMLRSLCTALRSMLNDLISPLD